MCVCTCIYAYMYMYMYMHACKCDFIIFFNFVCCPYHPNAQMNLKVQTSFHELNCDDIYTNVYVEKILKTECLTFIANKSPVVRFRARKTLPKAPLLIGLIISKSSMLVRSLCKGCRGVDIGLK